MREVKYKLRHFVYNKENCYEFFIKHSTFNKEEHEVKIV